MAIAGLNRIQAAFSRDSVAANTTGSAQATCGGPGMVSPLLNIYFTAGYPYPGATTELLLAIDDAGVDFIELGLPYSDPLADGPVIQESAQQALKAGITLDMIFRQVAEMRAAVRAPIIAMGYYNQVLRYGTVKFLDACVRSGIDGLIIPDLPIEMYRRDFRDEFEKRNLGISFLVTPNTPAARIREIDALCRGFLYVVSSASTTGSSHLQAEKVREFLRRLSEMDLRSPRLVGFNIREKSDLDNLLPYAAGGIIGSAFIRALEAEDLTGTARRFISALRG